MARRRGRSSAPSPGCGNTQCPAEETMSVISVADRLLSTWPGTGRLILVLVVSAALTTGVLTIAPVDVEVGPIKLIHMPTTQEDDPPSR